MKVTGLENLRKLSQELKNLKRKVDQESKWAVEALYKNATTIYERKINDLVYEEYDPLIYKRTQHLLGAHGAKDEEIKMSGSSKKYKFSIDENSRDPVDGTTWKQKADAIEQGDMAFKRGTTPFKRPFINETQNELEWENKRTADELERSVNRMIDKIAKG